jgi:eukaryotic-like serine/threonine-protein kinase
MVALQERLTREAQAMAQLAHPNVVTVYDLFSHEQQLFIAMELIDGPSLARWLQRPGRTWREVLDAFVQAGEGLNERARRGARASRLQARHVLVDEARRRVCVTDFGLACLGASAAPGFADVRVSAGTAVTPDRVADGHAGIHGARAVSR